MWNVGMGPAASRSTSGGTMNSLGVMPPPPIQLNITNITATPVISLGMGNTPPGVS